MARLNLIFDFRLQVCYLSELRFNFCNQDNIYQTYIGGLAGGLSNALLHPIDTIKTMQQSDKKIKGFRGALEKLWGDPKRFTKMYSGYWAAVFGKWSSVVDKPYVLNHI
jgi:hypothetical protein